MGLDWLVGNKPKPGHERQFADLLEASRSEEGLTEEQHAQYEEISIPAFSQVGAPRAGTDRIADAWVLWRVRSKARVDAGKADDLPFEPDAPGAHEPRDDHERDVLADMAGYYVLELAPPSAGLPMYTMGVFGEVDLTSFRGKFLDDCQDLLGEALFARAYENQTPEELVEYGTQLLELASSFAAERGIPHVAELEDPPEEGTDESRAHILFAAARWCRYWGGRGHFLEAWY
ncbi:MAG: hypothetical protein H6722_34805 [Sandaracinus sp.]|nr:hypothetical protein [Sandaracinus sp.]